MIPPQASTRSNRPWLLAGAALGGVVVGMVVLRLISGGGGDDRAGVALQVPPRPASTTTTTSEPPAQTSAAAALAGARDPFGQLVTVAETPLTGQSSPAGSPAPAPAPAAAAAAAAKPAPTTTSTVAPTTTTTTTTQRAPIVQALQPPPPASAPPPPIAPNTVAATVGPVAVASAPVNVCVDTGTRHCWLTGPATSLSLAVSATVDPAATTPPTITPAACSNGQGAALLVNAGSAGTMIQATMAVTITGAAVPFGMILRAPTANQSVILSACVAPGVGVAYTGAPVPPAIAGQEGGLLQPLSGLLGLLGLDL